VGLILLKYCLRLLLFFDVCPHRASKLSCFGDRDFLLHLQEVLPWLEVAVMCYEHWKDATLKTLGIESQQKKLRFRIHHQHW
jgi:hypothetical protein